METGTLGRKRKPVGESTEQPVGVNVKGAPAWRKWVERAAAHSRMGVSAYVDYALARTAKAEGFLEQPPDRLPKSNDSGQTPP